VARSTKSGHESLNLLSWASNKVPTAAMIENASTSVTVIARIRLNLNLTKKFTTGLSTMAKIAAKTNGTSMLRQMNNIANNANMPTKSSVALA
jgi:hypothetical protein